MGEEVSVAGARAEANEKRCKTCEVESDELKSKLHEAGQQLERLQDDKNAAVVEAESAKMLARELQGKVDGLQAAEESFKTTAEAAEAEAAREKQRGDKVES